MSKSALAITIEAARRISRAMRPSKKIQPLVRDGSQPDGAEIWVSETYEVTARRYIAGWVIGNGPWVQLGICCRNGDARHDWRDFQQIKNQLAGEDWEALELYPAESRLLDPSNYYLLYAAPTLPFGKRIGRQIAGPDIAVAPQRGWERGAEPGECMCRGCKIGDGTAPPHWPGYRSYSKPPMRAVTGVQCTFNGCGHIGSLGSPAKMECKGLECECTCCQFLAGAKLHGVTYGR